MCCKAVPEWVSGGLGGSFRGRWGLLRGPGRVPRGAPEGVIGGLERVLRGHGGDLGRSREGFWGASGGPELVLEGLWSSGAQTLVKFKGFGAPRAPNAAK